MTDAI